MITRFKSLVNSVMAQMQNYHSRFRYGGLEPEDIEDIVETYNGFMTKPIAQSEHLIWWFKSECDEDDDVKDIIETLELIRDYDEELRMCEAYESIDTKRYCIQLTGVRGENDIQFNIYDREIGDYLDDGDPEHYYYYGKTYSTPTGEAVNVKIDDKVYTFASRDRLGR